MKRVFKDTPLDEITLRRFEKPTNEDLKELSRKFLISVGLLQSGDSRDIISEIFYNFIIASKRQEFLEPESISETFKQVEGGTPSNIRRHLRRLKRLNLIEHTPYGYRLKEFMKISELFKEEIIRQLIEPALNRIKDYAEKIDELN